MGRRKARETAFKATYQIEYIEKKDGLFKPDEVTKILDFCFEEDESSEEEKIFVNMLLKGVVSNLEKIDGVILSKLKGWSVERISKVDLAILRLACFEILYTEVPVKVAANEAVELAKEYGNDDSSNFVNGVIAKIIESKG